MWGTMCMDAAIGLQAHSRANFGPTWALEGAHPAMKQIGRINIISWARLLVTFRSFTAAAGSGGRADAVSRPLDGSEMRSLLHNAWPLAQEGDKLASADSQWATGLAGIDVVTHRFGFFAMRSASKEKLKHVEM